MNESKGFRLIALLVVVAVSVLLVVCTTNLKAGDGSEEKKERRILSNWDMSSFEQDLFYRRERLNP